MSKYEDTCVLKKLLAAGKNHTDFIKNNTALNKIKGITFVFQLWNQSRPDHLKSAQEYQNIRRKMLIVISNAHSLCNSA